ncbi:MAG: CARDB domain-containing protein, partial [Tepidisphaeraceae bacterium]
TESLESRQLLASDLTTSLSITPGAVLPGGTINFKFSVSNLGLTTVTPTFSVDFRLSKDTTWGNADDVGNVSVPVSTDVPPGTFPVDFDAALPIGVAAAGQYFVGIFIDSGNSVAESNENNNKTFSSLAAIDVLTAAGVLVVPGTGVKDTIRLSRSGTTLTVKIDPSTVRNYSTNLVKGVLVQAGAGNDYIYINNGVRNVTAYGDNGDDYIKDGDQANTLNGGSGNDRIYAGAGNDKVTGGSNNDKLYGENGHDRIYGDSGNDWLDGGNHNDRLYDSSGTDTFYGQAGDDTIYCRDSRNEFVFGGLGIDGVQHDVGDILNGTETEIV